jgi:hypothetical protein
MNGDLLAATFLLSNVHNVIDVMQIEIHTTEPLLSGPSHLEVEKAGKVYISRQ